MKKEILESNVPLMLFEKYPWLSQIKQPSLNFPLYILELSKFNLEKSNLPLRKFVLNATFGEGIFDLLKESLVDFGLFNIEKMVTWGAIFQPNNETVLFASFGINAKNCDITSYVEVWTTSLENFYKVAESLSPYYYQENRNSVGFNV